MHLGLTPGACKLLNQVARIGSVSYKTAVLLDLVHNRLTEKGINSTFKEMKIFTGGGSRRDGEKEVAIGGRALLSSQLACEYVTLGSHIIYFLRAIQVLPENLGIRLSFIFLLVLAFPNGQSPYRLLEQPFSENYHEC